MSNSRIPADKSASFSAWTLPEVKRGQVVQAEKLKNRGPHGELLDVGRDEVVYNTITAAQLEEISQAAYDDVRESAHKEGLEQGYSEGYQAGIQAAQADVQQQVAALQQTVASLMSFLGEQDDQVEQALVNLATTMASSILRRELALDSRHILEVVHQAVQMLPTNVDNLTVHLSEQDYQLLTEHATLADNWQLRVDSAMTPGGCRVTSRHSVVDFTLEDQFQQTVNAIVERRYAELGSRRDDVSTPRDED